MKKILLCLMTAMMVTVSGVSLSSCSHDDGVNYEGSNRRIIISIVGSWSKVLSGDERVGCRFDSNGNVYFDRWTVNPEWVDPCKWIVNANKVIVTTPSGIIAFTADFFVSSDGKYIVFSNVNTLNDWTEFRSLTGILNKL